MSTDASAGPTSNEHTHAAPRGSRFAAELRDAVTPRAFGLVAAVLLLQLGFILSYLGAFHDPTPHKIDVAVVATAGAPAGTAEQVAGRLNQIAGTPLQAVTVSDEAAARARIGRREVYGAILLGAQTQDRLLVSSAAGGAVSEALTRVVTAADTQQQRTVAVEDVRPAGTGDARGLSAFYLAVGWVVGGYLVASILAIGGGARPANGHRAAIRLGALAIYSVVSGLGGALIVETVLGALSGHFLTLAFFGMLVVFAVGAFTMAIQTLTGIVGIGIAVALFVVLGNPSAGGAYPAPLLPTFWRAIGPWLPPGAGTSGVRGIAYFGNAGVGRACWVLASYAVFGVVVTLLVARSRREQGAHGRTAHASVPAG